MRTTVEAYSISNAAAVISGSTVERRKLNIEAKNLSGKNGTGPDLDLGGASYLYPALVNIHDHFRGNYVPRVGPSGDAFYLNWAPWDNDLKASPVYKERANITVEQMYFLSSYKNLLSGVATANDHFPHKINAPFLPRLPIRVIGEYTLEHECSSFDLKWGDGIEIEHKRAVERGWPFITHLEEGFDPESQDGVPILERLGCLDNHDVFIHCIGFSDEDIAKVAKAGASVSWCPASNMLMFNVTCKIRKFLKAGINVSLGTDSTHTGSANLLAEMKYARTVYRDMYGEELPAKILFQMVTINPAKAFWMQDRIGTLDSGKSADVLVLNAIHDDPYEALARAEPSDIRLLTLEGVPLLVEEALAKPFQERLAKGYEAIRMGGRKVFVRGNPASLYREVRKAIGFAKKLDYMPFEP